MDGDAPIFPYLGDEGYLLNAELREGKLQCQKGTPQFQRETLDLSKCVINPTSKYCKSQWFNQLKSWVITLTPALSLEAMENDNH